MWKKKAQEKAAKTPRPKTKVVKRPAKKKAVESIGLNLDEDLDNPDSEVELDSLGSLFIHLIDNDYYQDDAEGSQADDAEVITLSSGSGTPSTQKIRQTIWKINFSYPLAHLDPRFLLKKQHHEACRTTQPSGQVVTSAGLPNTLVRKRRPEVSPTSNTSYPKAGYF